MKGNQAMKRHEHSRLIAHCSRKPGSGTLVTYSDTLEGIKEEIDRANCRAEKLGYKQTTFTITCEEVYLWVDDDGNFMKRETYENIVEVYPKGDEQK